MSTFDGCVKEFPNIRIDYFRSHPDRPPPAACFLSHVHSDHLQGLETLRMPFVYCSATTRRFLLRMEKYPHRTNFAKGILESRKQTYKHLEFVLRALPLQTTTEIELSPKSKVMVTLFDANHCPGAVSFLIQGDGHAILYTGDVRAEPWWVNSIVQNPFILPYACGHKKLDCTYLDTTFASHEDFYRRFPTKAEGLKELLEKTFKFPNDTIFYFRAWTLGYEHVWMTLSNALQSQVHVDSYLYRLFNGITENGRDGFSMFEGPALTGFTVGNETQGGCLTLSAATRIHSCEPGMHCHENLKKRNVVWITPIVSRLADGAEVLEIGAGGGVGDFYQILELDVSDLAIMQGLAVLCADLDINAKTTDELWDTITVAQKSGNSRISLEALGLDTDAQISLREFVELMAKRDKAPKPCAKDPREDIDDGLTDRDIHFPYSRHSSLEELRHLISVFRPKDICACTVELESWSEDVSMRSLFGDLCSENVFHHDQEVRKEVNDLMKFRESNACLKRKREDDSQIQDDESQDPIKEVSKIAREILSSSSEKTNGVTNAKDMTKEQSGSDQSDAMRQRLSMVKRPGSHDAGLLAARPRKSTLNQVKEEFHALNCGSNFITVNNNSYEDDIEEEQNESDTQMSMSSSIFGSQDLNNGPVIDSQVDSVQDIHLTDGTSGQGRSVRRRSGYMAATRSLKHNDNSDWDDMSLRSLGRKGHTVKEMEI